jgi:tRNA A-37 threonylcarbamoyl transferase component Bud32
MTPPFPKSESRENSPHWDEYLLARLEEFESALHRGSVPPLSDPKDLSDCPPEIAAELRRLQSLLLWVENVVPPSNVQSGANVKSAGSTTTPDSEPQTLPLPSASPRSSPDQSWSDLRMGRFELGLKLGEGTYGIVYLAQDPRLKRLVALKIPRLDAAFREDLRERFIREGESAARLTHPNIVTVFEAVSEGPVSFIASEYIPGPNLAAWLAEHSPLPIPPREAARLIADLAAGVAHAHAKHVLHRDIKPSNILLAPRTENPNSLGDYHPKLTDFGLAKLLETQDATLSGAIVGTPAYMPPEQIAGETAQIGPAVDIYALGMVLYQLLTGSNPFLKPSVGETIHAVTSANLPAPSGIHRAVPRDLETICLKCLRRDRHERYATAADLAADLERYLTSRPIRARNVSPLERAIKWTRRYPALTTSTLAAFGLLMMLLFISAREKGELAAALAESDRQKQRAEDRELELLRKTYLEDMQRAGVDWNSNDTGIALDILKTYVPKPGEPDVRDFAWWAIWNEYHDNSRVIGTHEGGATAVACTSMAPYAAFTGGQDAVIKIWSIPDGKPIGELNGHTLGPIQSLELSPDESLLLSAAEDGTVRIWDIATCTEKMVFREHLGWVATAPLLPRRQKSRLRRRGSSHPHLGRRIRRGVANSEGTYRHGPGTRFPTRL